MGSPSKQERECRVALVQQRIGERGWSMRVMRDLAKEIGVTSRTIRAYRAEVIESLRKEITEADREQMRAEFLDRLKGHQQQALIDGKYGPLAAMLSIETRITGMEAPQITRTDQEIGALSRQQLLEELADDLSAKELAELQRIKAGK